MSSPTSPTQDTFYDAKSQISEPLSPIILSGDEDQLKLSPIKEMEPPKDNSQNNSPIKTEQSISPVKSISKQSSEQVSPINIPNGSSLVKDKENSSPTKEISPTKSAASKESKSASKEPSLSKSASPTKSQASPTKDPSPAKSDKSHEHTLETSSVADSDGQTIQFKNEQPPEDLNEIEEEEENGMNDDLAKEFDSLMQHHQDSAPEDTEDEFQFTGEKLEAQEDAIIQPLSFGLKMKSAPIAKAVVVVDVDDDDFDDFETNATVAPPKEAEEDDFDDFQGSEKSTKSEEIASPSINNKDVQDLLDFKHIFDQGSEAIIQLFTDKLPKDEVDHIYSDSDRDIGEIIEIATPYGPKLYFEPTEYLKELKEYQELQGMFESNFTPKDQKAFIWQKSNLRRKLLQLSGMPLNLDEFYTNKQIRKFGALSKTEFGNIQQLLENIEHLNKADLDAKKLEELGTIHLSIEKALGRLKDANLWYLQQNEKIKINIDTAHKEIQKQVQEAQNKKKTAATAKKKFFY